MAALKKIFGSSKFHAEPSKGSAQSNYDYCTKDESRLAGPWETGTRSVCSQGDRTDLEAVRDAIRGGATELEIAERNFAAWCRYRTSFGAYAALSAPKRGNTQVTPVTVLLGPTGMGKTFYVLGEDPDVFVKALDARWWDGFTGTQSVLFDDFRGAFPFRELLRLANPGAYSVEIKGGRCNFNPPKIYITSNIRPDHWYNTGTIDPAPLLRRITEILFFSAFKECHRFATDEGYPEGATKNAWQKFQESEFFEMSQCFGKE